MRQTPFNRSRLSLATAAIAAVAAIAAAPAQAAKPVKSKPKPVSCANADLVPNAANGASIRSATLCLINVERRARGLRALRSNSRLRNAAQRYAEQMVRQSFFGHVSPAGSTVLQRIRKASYLKSARAYSVGENLAWGTRELATPRQTVRNWMNSPPHRRNMLDRGFREIGIGIAIGVPQGSDPGATYATEFGRRS
jgi:uncharacterized protein YkwD